ncbi:T9SS type A sorting domain-containing protein [bacterium]|nr:T9SS type A sorting domain-containing protein [bacterium]
MRISSYLFFAVTLFLCTILPTNTAVGDLSVNPYGMAVSVDENAQSENELILSNEGDEEIGYSIGIMPQELERIISGAPFRDERGGPDDATYEWRDWEEDDCPQYSWIDIREFDGVVDIEQIYDDSSAGEYEFGFTVNYYGNEFDRMTIYPNGMIVMGEDPNTIIYFRPLNQWPEDLPTDSAAANSETPPPNLICVAYQDLNPIVAGNIYFWSDENQAICTWQGVPHFQDANAENDLWTFQVIVNASGLIVFQYAEIGMYDDADIMIGFQNEERDLGFTIIRNDFDYLQAETIIALGPEEAWITWVSIDPKSGQIAANEDETVNVVFNAEEVDEDGVYYAILKIDIDGVDQEAIEIPMIMSVVSPVGAIEGTIINAADNTPIANAPVVLEQFGLMRLTNDEGYFQMLDIPVGGYDLTCHVTDFLPFMIEELEVRENETTDGSMALLHATCDPDPPRIDIEMDADDQYEADFSITNNGNGTLEYTVEKRLEGGGDADPWELRSTIPVTEIVRDSRVEGVAYGSGHYYVAGANIYSGDDGENMIYVLNKDGEEINRFGQFGESNYGFKDMTYDGDLFWGTADRDVIGFNADGDSIAAFQGPEGTLNAIAWDPDRERLWMARKTGRSIYAYSRDGDADRGLELENNDFRIYGLAYWSNDPDGYQLYIFHFVDEGQEVYKMNIDDGETMFVRELEPDQSGNAGGIMITNQYDPLSWVMITTVNDGSDDRINVWQLVGRQDWLSLEPETGEVLPDSVQQFVLGVNSESFPPLEIGGELLFTHNGVRGETVIPFTITVFGAPENEPPSEFNLLEPVNNDTLDFGGEVTFSWQPSIDPDPEDTVSYVIWFSSEALEDSVCFSLSDTTVNIALQDSLFGEEAFNACWWVKAVSGEDTVECLERFTFHRHSSAVDGSELGLPTEFAIQGIYPNPFNAQTRINYSLKQTSQTVLTIYDILGREAFSMDYGVQQPGWYKAVIDASTLPSGIYIVNLRADKEIRNAKMMCIK